MEGKNHLFKEYSILGMGCYWFVFKKKYFSDFPPSGEIYIYQVSISDYHLVSFEIILKHPVKSPWMTVIYSTMPLILDQIIDSIITAT